jgi:hypothetical protein
VLDEVVDEARRFVQLASSLPPIGLGGVRLVGSDDAERLFEPGIGDMPELAFVAALDVSDDLVAQTHPSPASLRRDDEFGTAVGIVIDTANVAELFEFVDDGGDRLLVAARYLGKVGQPNPRLVQVGEDGAMARSKVVEPRLGGPTEQLALDSQQESRCEHAQIRVGQLSR